MAAVTLSKNEGKGITPVRTQVVVPFDSKDLSPEVRAFFVAVVTELNVIKSDIAVLQAKMAKAQSV